MGEIARFTKPRHGAKDRGAVVFRPIRGFPRAPFSHGSRHGLFSVARSGWSSVLGYSLRTDSPEFLRNRSLPTLCETWGDPQPEDLRPIRRLWTYNSCGTWQRVDWREHPDN